MSGGYYKYHCKYWWSLNCENWVYVNGSPCARCCAEGRENEQSPMALDLWRLSRDICAPRMHGGAINYTLMEIVHHGEASNDRVLCRKALPQTAGQHIGVEVVRTMPDVPTPKTRI
ncbi:uncharacterized protein B0I36DRAFT_357921 [Microdochium trichocladiopsis]|uniref:Uncharacterized protein n=1 Tax=Microdochium trichocladiopsis TaxID=1682393 RepID=A0A9P9BWJ2_9PEZI|nr:uncharacterized protein B0I36DRAFT_357921 [Microdochium trichocladiopsis]KAH7040650.1 hypothetical protein B0I36DRAFT_357921 [Microdochium trichocladiopsis]